MGTIIQSNNFNPANLQAPGLYINNVPPAPYIPGAPTNVGMVIGTASWGPVNAPVIGSSPQDFLTNFGGVTAAALTDVHDMCTDAAIAFQQGYISLWGCRVTDGTDHKAAVTLEDNESPTPVSGAQVVALWSGNLGNSIQVTIAPSSISGASDVYVSSSFGAGEQFKRIPNSTFWASLQTAFASGIAGQTPPSSYVRIPSGAQNINTNAQSPALGTFSLAGGTDGRSGISTDNLLGQNQTLPMTGIYTAPGLSPIPQKMWIAGLTDTQAVATLKSFCEANAIFTAIAFPAGTSTSQALASIQNTGQGSYEISYLKDWVYWNDLDNGVVRLVPPYGFTMGLITSLSPAQSPLNKQVQGVIGTERNSPETGNVPYGSGEIAQLMDAGVLIITNPIPAGAVFGIATGKNTAVNDAEAPVEYSTMTNFCDLSIQEVMGQFTGMNQSQQKNDPLRQQVRHVLNNWTQGLLDAGLIDAVVQVTCTMANSGNPQQGINTPASIAQHYLYALVALRYLSSVWAFVISMQGGTTVVSVSPVPGA